MQAEPLDKVYFSVATRKQNDSGRGKRKFKEIREPLAVKGLTKKFSELTNRKFSNKPLKKFKQFKTAEQLENNKLKKLGKKLSKFRAERGLSSSLPPVGNEKELLDKLKDKADLSLLGPVEKKIELDKRGEEKRLQQELLKKQLEKLNEKPIAQLAPIKLLEEDPAFKARSGAEKAVIKKFLRTNFKRGEQNDIVHQYLNSAVPIRNAILEQFITVTTVPSTSQIEEYIDKAEERFEKSGKQPVIKTTLPQAKSKKFKAKTGAAGGKPTYLTPLGKMVLGTSPKAPSPTPSTLSPSGLPRSSPTGAPVPVALSPVPVALSPVPVALSPVSAASGGIDYQAFMNELGTHDTSTLNNKTADRILKRAGFKPEVGKGSLQKNIDSIEQIKVKAESLGIKPAKVTPFSKLKGAFSGFSSPTGKGLNLRSKRAHLFGGALGNALLQNRADEFIAKLKNHNPKHPAIKKVVMMKRHAQRQYNKMYKENGGDMLDYVNHELSTGISNLKQRGANALNTLKNSIGNAGHALIDDFKSDPGKWLQIAGNVINRFS